jgi:hypothetical protein
MTDKKILTSFMEGILNVPKKYQGGTGIGTGTGTGTGTGIRKKPARASYKKQLMELLAHEEIKAIKSYDEICTRYKKINGPIPASVPVPLFPKKPKKNDATLEHAIKFMHNGTKFIIYNKKIYDETGKYLFPDITHLSIVVPESNLVSGKDTGIGTGTGTGTEITKFMDKELGEFIKMDSILYSQIHDKYAILTGEIVDDNICIYQGYTDS